ncbi:MAG: hypothetical protein QM698_11985 [Micropepsaceae bacterium]
MPKPLRIFISSPGDVSAERRRAALVVESLKKEFARFFEISAYLWEHEAMLATGHFQDVIAPPSQSDIVVLILWSRLGTPLPEKSGEREYKGIDGRSPVTGTEWEYEDALAANRAKGAPDLLVYRSNREPQISLRDPNKKALAEGQWNALETFWSRYFQAGGVFLSAYHGFDDLEDFGDMLEAHLRQLIRSRIEKGRIEAGSDVRATWMQSPFRGLSSFDFEHAPIFFGRGAAQLKAVEQIVRNASEGRAFLLVLGASGSGKSSLVRAGLLPNLFARGVADGAGLWRRVVFKPGDADGNLFAGLVKALTENRVKDGIGLPEIQGAGVTAEQLEAALRRSIDDPSFVFAPALGKVTHEARAAGHIMAHENAKLALVLDQLEEIFTDPAIATEERNSFIRLIASLTRTGMVWVVGSMRSDFWHRAAAAPELVALADGTGRIDLLPPSQAELAEMIRRPAAAAGLSFEDHSETRIGLDGVIAEEASRDPGSLPLVSFMLDALYKTDIESGKGGVLTYNTYEALGGIKGAIATRADEILNAQPADVQGALPSVLRALVTVDGDRDQNATARMAPLTAFPMGSPRRALVDAFLNPAARLLIADGDGGEARVRVAHEALINHWARAREQINRDRRDLETRARLEEDEALWRAAPPAEKSARLLEGLALEEGKDLVRKWDDELPQSLKDYITESRKAAESRRRRSFRIMTGIAAVMAVLAAGAVVLGYFAQQESDRAQEQTVIAQGESERAKAAESRAEDQLKETQLGSARLVSKQSNIASKAGNSELALALAVESVRIAEETGRDLPLASLSALQHAASTDTIAAVLADSVTEITWVDFAANVNSAYTFGDGRLLVWNTFFGTERAFWGKRGSWVINATSDSSGKYLFILFDDKTGQTFNADTLEPAGNVVTFPAMPSLAHIDAQGREIVVGDEAGGVHFISTATGGVTSIAGVHQSAMAVAEIADNLSIAVTADSSGTVVIWDMATHTQRATITADDARSLRRIEGAALSPNGSQVVLWGGGSANIYDSAGVFVATIDISNEWFYNALFSPDGRTLYFTSGKNLYAAPTTDFKPARTYSGHTFDVRRLALSIDGKRALTSSGDNTVRLWDTASGATLRIFRSARIVKEIGLSQDGQYVLINYDDGTAVVYAVEALQPQSARMVHDFNINSVAWSPDGQYLLTSSNEGGGAKVVLSDVEFGHPAFSLPGSDDTMELASNFNNTVFTPDGTGILTADNLGRVRLWRASTGSPVRVIGNLPETYISQWVEVTPDGKNVLVARYQGISVFDFNGENAQEQRVFRAPNALLFTMAVSPDGTKVATGSSDGRIFVWDFASGELLFERREDKSQINAVNFSPDSKRLVTASSDRTIRVFDVATGEPTLLLSGHEDIVIWASFSPDGQRIASAGFDATARVWDANTGAELVTFKGPEKPFRSAVFSPDSKMLAVGGDDFRLYLWKLPEQNNANTPTSGPIVLSQLQADNGKMLKEMMAWAPLTVSKPLSPTDRRDNFLEPDTALKTFDPTAGACHRLAAFPADPDRLSAGVRDENIMSADAETACRRALEAAPNDARLHLQLGRALLNGGKEEEGRKEVQIAIDAQYPGAVYYLGLWLSGWKQNPTDDDLKTGYDLVRQAWALGIPDAGNHLAMAMQKSPVLSTGEPVVPLDEAGAVKLFEETAAKGSFWSSLQMGQKYEYGESGLERNELEALYYYGIATRQIEINGLMDTEQLLSGFLFARRASFARYLIRQGKSAEVAAVAERIANWKP